MINKYYKDIEDNLESVLIILKNDEALCNMLIDMVNNQHNTIDHAKKTKDIIDFT